MLAGMSIGVTPISVPSSITVAAGGSLTTRSVGGVWICSSTRREKAVPRLAISSVASTAPHMSHWVSTRASTFAEAGSTPPARWFPRRCSSRVGSCGVAAGRSRFEQQIEGVRAALAARAAPGSATLLGKTLRTGVGHVIATIADALDESDARLLDFLPESFVRLLDDPVKRDPGCRGKVAVVKALDRTEQRAFEVFERGARYVQNEPVWGGKVDTAAELRGVCGMALVHARHPRALVEVALLLADREHVARIAGARALAVSGDRPAAEPLLRLRIAIGDTESEVLGECFAALLELAGVDAIDDVAAYLWDADDAIAQAAALALGGSRLPGVLAVLRAADESLIGGRTRATRLLAMALLRDAEAWAYLLGLVASGSRAEAEDAVRALLTFRHDEELTARVRAAAQQSGDAHRVAVIAEALAEDG